MKVYEVSEVNYDDEYSIGVYDSIEKAEKAKLEAEKDDYYYGSIVITELEVQ